MIAPLYRHVLVDTGPLVAMFDRADQYHELCRETLRSIQPPMWTTWPVLTEVAWLLREHAAGLDLLYGGVDNGLFRIFPLDDSVLTELGAVRQRYQKLRPQLADMSLLWLAEKQRRTAIFTLDRRDFLVMQKKSRHKFVLLPETLD